MAYTSYEAFKRRNEAPKNTVTDVVGTGLLRTEERPGSAIPLPTRRYTSYSAFKERKYGGEEPKKPEEEEEPEKKESLFQRAKNFFTGKEDPVERATQPEVPSGPMTPAPPDVLEQIAARQEHRRTIFEAWQPEKIDEEQKTFFEKYRKNIAEPITRMSEGVVTGGLGTLQSMLAGMVWQSDALKAYREEQSTASRVVERAAAPQFSLLADIVGYTGEHAARPAKDKLKQWLNIIDQEHVKKYGDTNFGDQLARGVGSSAMFFVPGLAIAKAPVMLSTVSPKLAMWFGSSASAALEAMTEAGGVYEENIDQGKTREEASLAAAKTFWVNAIVVGVTNRFGILGDKGPLKQALMSAPLEGTQEFVQQVTQNIQTGRPWDEGVWEAAGVGAIIGPFMGAVTGISNLGTETKTAAPVADHTARYKTETEKTAQQSDEMTAQEPRGEEKIAETIPGTIKVTSTAQETGLSAETPTPGYATFQEERAAMQHANPTLYKQATQAETVDAFIGTLSNRADHSDVSVENLTEWYTRVHRIEKIAEGEKVVEPTPEERAAEKIHKEPTTAKERKDLLPKRTPEVRRARILARGQQVGLKLNNKKDNLVIPYDTDLNYDQYKALAAAYYREHNMVPTVTETGGKWNVYLPSFGDANNWNNFYINQDGVIRVEKHRGSGFDDPFEYERPEFQFNSEEEARAVLDKVVQPKQPTSIQKAQADIEEAKKLREQAPESSTDPDVKTKEWYSKYIKGTEAWIQKKQPTQKDQVKDVLKKKGEASIKDVAKETGIKEPNIRRILGVGTKEGTFERVAEGVYTLTKDGETLAYVETGNAVDVLPRLAEEGFKADMVFLDIPYDTKAVKGGNRGIKYKTISVEEFEKVVAAVKTILRTPDSPVIHMFSQAETGLADMQKYNDVLTDAGLTLVGRGEYQKTYKSGKPVVFPTPHGATITKPEGILVLTQSGKVKTDLQNLNFRLVRPRGWQTEKPAQMLKELIEMTTEEGDTVLDPFAGSGVTAEQAVKTGRKAVAVEVEKEAVKKHILPRVEKAANEKKVQEWEEWKKKNLTSDKWKGNNVKDLEAFAKSYENDITMEKVVYHGVQKQQDATSIRKNGFVDPSGGGVYTGTIDQISDVYYSAGNRNRMVAAIVRPGAKPLRALPTGTGQGTDAQTGKTFILENTELVGGDKQYDRYAPADLFPLPRGILEEAEVENYLAQLSEEAAPVNRTGNEPARFILTPREEATKAEQDAKYKTGVSKKALLDFVKAEGGKVELTATEETNQGAFFLTKTTDTSTTKIRSSALVGFDPDTLHLGDTVVLDKDVLKAKGTYYDMKAEHGPYVAQKAQRVEEYTEDVKKTEKAIQNKQENEVPFELSKNDIPFDLAEHAHDGISMRGGHGEREQNSYVETVKEVYNELREDAKTERQLDSLVNILMPQFRNKYRDLKIAHLNALSRVMSTMVVGRANFPVARNEKRMSTEQKRADEMWNYIETFKARARAGFKAIAVEEAGGPLAVAKAELKKMQDDLQQMKDANKVIKSKKLSDDQKRAQVSEIIPNLDNETLEDLLFRTDYPGPGFPSFSLTNLRNRIKTKEKNVADMERREELGPESEEIIFTKGDIQVVRNPAEDRVQILFPGKPDEAMRTKLKERAWRWSPRNSAWQRKLTRQAELDAQNLLADPEATPGDSFGFFRARPQIAPNDVELIRQWVSGNTGQLNRNSAARKRIRDAGVGLNRIHWDKSGHAIVYRSKGDRPRAGAVNGFSVTPRKGQEPYRISRKQALAYLNSKEYREMYRTYSKDGLLNDEKKASQMQLLNREDEVTAYIPQSASTKPYTPTPGDSAGLFSSEENLSKWDPEVTRMSEQMQGLQLPELVKLAKDLGANITIARDRKPGRMGFHQGGRINLIPEAFQDTAQVEKLLAHEMGHLNDYLPDQVSKRGTLPNRIAGTRQMLVKDFDGSLADQGTRTKIHKELKEMSRYWRPWDPAQATPKFTKYRNSGSELYADALSMLLVDPVRVQNMGPTFYNTFFEYLDAKPQFRKLYFELQEKLWQGPDAIQAERHEGVLEDFLTARELEEKKAKEREQWNKNVFHHARRLYDVHITAVERTAKAKKAGKTIPLEDDPVHAWKNYNYMAGQIKYYLESYIQPTMNRLNDAGISWDDFGAYLLYQRIAIGDRKTFANPRGLTPETATDQLDMMKRRLGDRKYQELEAARLHFSSGVKAVLEDAYTKGSLYTDELYQKMQDNPAYATFRTLSHIMDSEVTAQVHQQIGTFSGVAHPADVTIVKTVETIRALERNQAKLITLNFMLNNQELWPGEIVPAETKWDANLHTKVPVPPKEGNLKLIKVLRNGRVEGYYVHPEIAELFETQDTTRLRHAAAALQWFNNHGPRPLYIGLSLGFQTMNAQRDFRRAWRNLYVKQPNRNMLYLGLKLAKEYVKAGKASWNRAGGKPDEAIRELEKNYLLSVTFNRTLRGNDTEQNITEQLLGDFNIGDAAKNTKHEGWRRVLLPAQKAIEFIEKLGDTIETIPKVAGFRIMKEQGYTEEEAVDFVRTYVGSPDFRNRGLGYEWTNNIMLFSNAIKEGVRSDGILATQPETRFRWWYHFALTDIAPKLAMFAALFGAFGDDLRELFEGVSDYDMTNYDIIPIGKDENGKTVYIRIPKDENSRIYSAIIWKALTAADNEKPWNQDLADIVSLMGGQLPGLTPVLSWPATTFQFMTGKNPYDAFRGRYVLTDDEQKAGGWYRLEPYLRWSWQELGGNTIMRIETREYGGEEDTLYDTLIETPIIGNPIGRTVKISDYGITESLKQIGEQVEQGEARRRLEERELLRDYSQQIREARAEGGPLTNTKDIQRDFLRAVAEVRDTDSMTTADASSLIKRLRIASMESPEYDQYIDAVLVQNTNKAKLMVLQRLSEDMSEEEYTELLRILGKNKIISAPVYNTARAQQWDVLE